MRFIVCAACGEKNNPTFALCHKCKAPLTDDFVQCPFCESGISKTAKKCKYCGEWVHKNEDLNHELKRAKPPQSQPIVVKSGMSGCVLFLIIVLAIIFAVVILVMGL